jgi:acetoin utilization deacetylase AcuC-like enzyme
VLEGGYAVDALARSVAALMPVLGAAELPPPVAVPRHPLAEQALARG